MGLIHGLGRSPGGGNDNPLQYSCLENPMDRGCSPLGCKELDMIERFSLFTFQVELGLQHIFWGGGYTIQPRAPSFMKPMGRELRDLL